MQERIYNSDSNKEIKEEMNEFFNKLLEKTNKISSKKILKYKLSLDFSEGKETSLFVRIMIVILLILLNCFFIYYTIVQGYVRGYDWQKQYAISFLIQLICEITVFETVECIYCNFIIPNLIWNDVKVTYDLVKIHPCNDIESNIPNSEASQNTQSTQPIQQLQNLDDTYSEISELHQSEIDSIENDSEYKWMNLDNWNNWETLNDSNHSFNFSISELSDESIRSENSEKSDEVQFETLIEKYDIEAQVDTHIRNVEETKEEDKPVISKVDDNYFVYITVMIPFEIQRCLIRFITPFIFSGIILGFSKIGLIYSIILTLGFVVVSLLYYLLKNKTQSNTRSILPL